MSNVRVLSLGEALIDVVARGDASTEHVGGSLLNVAGGLGMLGHPTSIAAWWGPDERGDRIAAWASERHVDVVAGTAAAAKTSVAFATLDADGRATYEFDLTWDVPTIDELASFGHLHTGSIGATLEPGGSKVVSIAEAMRAHGTVSYDPNIRPALMASPDAVGPRVEALIALSDVVKASDEDVAWLYPDEPVEDVMRRWAKAGPALVVVTRGPWGAYALLANNRDMLHVDQMNVELADTVGAGDSFMAGLLSGLVDAGLLGSADARARLREAGWSAVQPALHRAVVTSGLTVGRHGAYAPTRAEVEAVQDADPSLR